MAEQEPSAAFMARALRNRGAIEDPMGPQTTDYLRRRLRPDQQDPPQSMYEYNADLNKLTPEEFQAKHGHLPGHEAK